MNTLTKRLALVLALTSFTAPAFAAPAQTTAAKTSGARAGQPAPKKKVVYAENQTLDFEGLSLDGELKAPGEFYFQNRNQEQFDALTKRRLNFRREMLRDSIQSN